MPLSDDERVLLDKEFATDKVEQQPDVRGIMERSSNVNPDRHAQVLDIATRRQLPTSTVDNNFDELKQRDAIDAADPSTFGPQLTKFFSDTDNATMFKDKAALLKQTESSFHLAPIGEQIQGVADIAKKTAGALAAGQHDISSSFYRLLQGGVDIARGATTDQMVNTGLIKEDKVLKPVSDFLGKASKNSSEWADYLAPNADGFIEQNVYGGIRSASSNITGVSAALAMGNPAYALGIMTAQTAGQTYGQGVDQNMDLTKNLLHTGINTALEYVTEKIPVGDLLKDLSHGRGFLATLASQQVEEGLGEQVATLTQNLSDWAMLPENKDKPFSAYLKEIPDNALQTAIQTAVATSFTTGIAHGVNRVIGGGDKKENEDKKQIQQSVADQTKIDEWITLGQSLKSDNGVMTDRVKDFLKGAGSENKIYVPMDIIRDVPNLPPSMASQINNLGGDVEIPIEDFMTHVVNDEKLMAIIKPHLTMGLDKLSATEIKEAGKDQEARSLLERANLKAQEQTVFDTYQEKFYNELVSTGRESKQEAATKALVHTAQLAQMARNSGISLQDVIDRAGLTVVGPGQYQPMTKGDEILDQPINVDGVKKVGSFTTDEGKFSYYDTEKMPRGRAQMFTVQESPDGWTVRNLILPETIRGKGIATKMYERLNQESIAKTGKSLKSSRPRITSSGEKLIELSDDGERLWKRLVSQGKAIQTGDKQYEFTKQVDQRGTFNASDSNILNQSSLQPENTSASLDLFNDKGEQNEQQRTIDELNANLQQWFDSTGLQSRGGNRLVGSQWQEPSRYRAESGTKNAFLKEGDAVTDEADGKLEQEKLIATAKENGFFFETDNPIFDALAPIKLFEGMEHEVQIVGEDNGKEVVIRTTKDGKFGHTSKYSPVEYLKRMSDYNKVFPDLHIGMIGVAQESDGKVSILTAQPFVKGKEAKNIEELDALLRKHGWFEEGAATQANRNRPRKYKHAATGAVINDVHPGNILIGEGGQLYPIDVYVEKMPTIKPQTLFQSTPETQLAKRRDMVALLAKCIQ